MRDGIKNCESDLQTLMTALASGYGGHDTFEKLAAVEKSYITFLENARKMCENVWAKFDLKMIFAGIITMALGVVLAIYFIVVFSDDKDGTSLALTPFIISGTILHLVYLTFHVTFLPASVPPVMVFIIAIVLIFICLISSKAKLKAVLFPYSFSFTNSATAVIFVSGSCMYFSNSFVVYEDRISLFLLQSLLFVLWFKIVVHNCSFKSKSEVSRPVMGKSSKKSKYSFDFLHCLTEPNQLAMMVMFLCAIFLRLSSNFYACREEQHQCKDSFFLVPLSNLDVGQRNQRYLLSIFCLGTLVYLSKYWLKYYGNLNGPYVSVLCLSYAPVMAAICACLHWAFQTLPQATLDNIPPWQQVIMARMAYLSILVSLLAILVSPLLVFVLPSRQDSLDLTKG